jgi:MoaA/NifB/PqqE/SkfB family radical SAM enzyme
MGGRAETRVPQAAVIAEMERAAADGYDSIGFLGGEITVYRGAETLFDRARGLGFSRIAICTNGRRLGDRKLLDSFLDAGVNRIALSIHSHRADVEDRITGRTGSFLEKMAAVRNCAAAAGEGRLLHGFAANSCMHGWNAGELRPMALFLAGAGAKDLRFNFLRPEHMAEGSRDLVPRVTDVAVEAAALAVMNERKRLGVITFGDIPLCAWPRRFLGGSSRAMRYIGELRDRGTDVTIFWRDECGAVPDRFAWGARRRRSLKRHVKACRECALAGSCEGPWRKYVDIYGDGEFKPLKFE